MDDQNVQPTHEQEQDQPAADSLHDQLNKCESEKAEYLDGWQRAKADYINFKNDERHRIEDAIRHLSSAIISDLIPVLDSFDLALDTMQGAKTPPAPQEERGFLLIRSQLADALEKRGLEPIAVKPGDQFTPELHEALAEIDSDHPPGTIHDAVQKGYLLNGIVLRPARVRISKQTG